MNDTMTDEIDILLTNLLSGKYLLLHVAYTEKFYTERFLHMLRVGAKMENPDETSSELSFEYFDDGQEAKHYSFPQINLMEYGQHNAFLTLAEDITGVPIHVLTKGRFYFYE